MINRIGVIDMINQGYVHCSIIYIREIVYQELVVERRRDDAFSNCTTSFRK